MPDFFSSHTPDSQKTQSYPYHKSMRIRRSSQYRWIQRVAQVVSADHLSIQWLFNKTGPRLGLTVSAKYGSAVARNRFKRRIKELFRLSFPSLQPGLVLHIRPRGRVKHPREVPSFNCLRQEWSQTLTRLGCVQSPS